MRGRRAAAATAAALACGLAVAASPPLKERVLFPPPNAVLLAGTQLVVAVSADATFRVDGKARSWEPFAPPVRVARVALSAGRRQLRVGKSAFSVRVVPSAKPGTVHEEGEATRAHPVAAGADGCAACHETSRRDGRTAVGALRSSRACLRCHTPVQFEAAHSHPLEPISHCQDCHALHASRRKALLNTPVRKLCGACHES